MSVPINLADHATLIKAATTSLSSKIVAQDTKLAQMAVDSVMKTIDPRHADNVDLKNIRVLKKVGGTIDDSEMVDGLVLQQQVVKSGGGPTRMEKARIGLIQFQLSPPKPDVCGPPYHKWLLMAAKKLKGSQLTSAIDGESNRCERLPPNG